MTATAEKPEFATAVGNMPALNWCRLDQLHIDDAYQRSIDTPGSQSMIRAIARKWNWDLCQPLFVAKRDDGRMYVVDGQHRLAAAIMREDIDQLPCIVSMTSGSAQEAQLFSEFNRRRRAPSQLDLYFADLAAGEPTATDINCALIAAGLSMSKHTNAGSFKPGQVMNIAGLRNCLRVHGLDVLSVACDQMAKGWAGQRLQYAGTLFPGIAELVRHERALAQRAPCWAEGPRVQAIAPFLASKQQMDWYGLVMRAKGDTPGTNTHVISGQVLLQHWTAKHPGGA
ncbi:hypothetical protein IP68_02345 [Blastomonas sp. AAP25]|uniref:DUF6551 family protein n=1 Tax=Blastomonas sp. AAP25 TaxID=1523416 RepID=UPI0006B91E69|nr:DUF6551 family protein [Blastomonas sp. AAP25]KPF76754.1 hypothetical protein IP68_02345 [Blastomonas sp. AAP25]